MIIEKSDLTQAILHEYLDYCPVTGHLTWKTKKHSRKVVIGARAGSISSTHKHRVIKFAGKLYPEHRLIWLHYYGVWPAGHIDHINHNEQDNSINNLRDVSQQENNINSSKRKDNSTGFTGIWINKLNPKKKYIAEVKLKGKRVHYSSHLTLEEAVIARNLAYVQYGFHPNHGIDKPL